MDFLEKGYEESVDGVDWVHEVVSLGKGSLH